MNNKELKSYLIDKIEADYYGQTWSDMYFDTNIYEEFEKKKEDAIKAVKRLELFDKFIEEMDKLDNENKSSEKLAYQIYLKASEII